jgi:hypothetical protein
MDNPEKTGNIGYTRRRHRKINCSYPTENKTGNEVGWF